VEGAGSPIKLGNIGVVHAALETMSHAGAHTTKPGCGCVCGTRCHFVCVCVCVRARCKCFPWDSRQPTDAEGSPDCRCTQETDTVPQAATFPDAILPLFYHLFDSYTSYHPQANIITVQPYWNSGKIASRLFGMLFDA
jgi:hypothetical protein